jgi:transposase-like protein
MNESMSENVRLCPTWENDLSDKQRLAVDLLASGRSMKDTAQAVGVDPRTLFRWRQDESFGEELGERRRELHSVASDRLGALLEPALDVLEQQLNDRYDRARFRAAATILRLARVGSSSRCDHRDDDR